MNNFICPNKIGWRLGFLVAVLLWAPPRVVAQLGNDNPTGPAGAFNGNITTGCSYDPLTGNATRAITDLVVAGGVGRYPLAFGRTANSRYQRDDAFAFGPSGGWRHSYAWDIDGSETFPTTTTPPTVYPVSFPDGRTVNFWASSSDIYFRGPPGVRERFQPLNFSTMRAYLILPDGGKIEFKATRHSECIPELHRFCTYTYTYQAQAIFDPFGLKTTLTYNSDGSLNTVQEFGGRWLQLSYVNGLIGHVLASDGRVVQYNYLQGTFSPGTLAYTYLANVVYPFEPSLGLSPTAVYAYQAPNGSNPNGYPLLSTCDDPMYGGPMKKLSYSYATSNGGSIPVVAGQILSENSGTTGQIVSRLYVQTTTWRNEIRGDGPVRHLEYDGPLLKRFTDFKNVQSFQSYDGSSYVNLISNGNQHVTDLVNNPLTGATTQVTYPLTPSESVRASVQYVYGGPGCDDPKNQDGNNPYYLCRMTDERGNVTRYWRDDSKRVTQITYPNGASETFAYNNLNQITSHRLRPLSASIPGGLETFVYDSSGKLLQYRDPYHPAVIDSQHPEIPTTTLPSISYGYDSLGRVASVTDAANHATTFLYNTCGQTTRVTHAVDGSYTQAAYNVDGTLAWTADENHPGAATDPNQRKRLGYDDYKRVISVTEPGLPPATFIYAQDFVNSYVQTTSNVKGAFSPMGKTVHYAYDENWRRTIKREAPETADDAWTFFGYDNVGNMTWMQDPRGKVTNMGYDQRNRRTSVTNPAPFNSEIIRWEYDPASNVTKMIRPDLAYQRTVYDSMNRVTDTYGFANERTQHLRDLAGNVTQMIDSKNASYGYGYDLLNRKVSANYPADVYNVQRTESWRYDTAGRMDLYRNLADEYKHIEYDARNRPQRSYWNWSSTSTTPDWFGPETISQFDAASRVTSVATKLWGTNNNETVVAFGYDDANRQIWEDQTLAGYPTRRIETPRDPDGNRDYLHVPGYYLLFYDYTQRNQLAHIRDPNNNNPVWTYTYDSSGNVTNRFGQWGLPNGVNYGYDALNRIELVEQGNATQVFARSHYKYDNVGREVATWRDEQSNKGERFSYNADNQLSTAVYNADNVWTENPSNWSKRREYYFSTGLLNWQWVNDNGYWAPFANNGVNQYTSVNGSAPQYDGNLNLIGLSGFSGSYDAENRLIWGIRNGKTLLFTYDGLGRCVRRTVNGSSATLFTYDGWNPIIEWDQAGNWKAMNLYGFGADEILGRYDATLGHLIYKQDKRGNVTFLLNPSNQIIEKYTYDAFGAPTITDANGTLRSESAPGNRFMFTGREYIKELGIYDYRHRVYDPGIGRFLQHDPTGFAAGDANLFRYCGGDPVNRRDPSGLADKNDNRKPTVPIKPYEPTHFGSNGYTPTGSHIPQTVSGVPNGPGWDLSSHDYINGTQSLGTFLLLGTGGTGGSSSGGGGGEGAQFVRADALLFGLDTPMAGVAYVNGVPYYTPAALVNALLSAEPGSITNLTIVGHGDSESIGIGLSGALIYRSDGNGGYNFAITGYGNINSLLSSLSSNATINFFGCNTATGEMNLPRAFSSTFSGTTVTGFTEPGYAAHPPYLPAVFFWGPTATFQGGQQVPASSQFHWYW